MSCARCVCADARVLQAFAPSHYLFGSADAIAADTIDETHVLPINNLYCSCLVVAYVWSVSLQIIAYANLLAVHVAFVSAFDCCKRLRCHIMISESVDAIAADIADAMPPAPGQHPGFEIC